MPDHFRRRNHAMHIKPCIAAIITAAVATPALAAPSTATSRPASHAALAGFFTEWRAFAVPRGADGRPDYGPAAIAAQAAQLPAWRARLAAIDTRGWPVAALNDKRLIEAEINGLDFNHRILKPWARDPGFYATIAADESDVPAHEGQYAEPFIDLYAFKWPLSRTDDARLTTLLAGVPAQLAEARANLANSNARDLWLYGDRAFTEQADMLAALAAGTLKMRTVEGPIAADMTGASPGLGAGLNPPRPPPTASCARRSPPRAPRHRILPPGWPAKHRKRPDHQVSARQTIAGTPGTFCWCRMIGTRRPYCCNASLTAPSPVCGWRRPATARCHR
jgi:hypothetical protein